MEYAKCWIAKSQGAWKVPTRGFQAQRRDLDMLRSGRCLLLFTNEKRDGSTDEIKCADRCNNHDRNASKSGSYADDPHATAIPKPTRFFV